MDAMVMEMLDLSRLEAGKVKLARDHFDLTEMVRDTFEKLRPMAEEKRLHIQLQLKENCMVNADEGRIAQAVMNLASNAVRYTPAGGNITVTLGLVWRQIVLTIANDCESFTEEELEKVWESFYRRDKSRDRKGTGLGLAITRQIVQLHSGSCYVKNTDTGVEFGIKLPN
jgi:signal transduction histidine kinase